ncbi:MAG TPA: endonuclease/exonuclease/phosphatase family protein [Campylobacterales bacterium]|nr:endonuclease/exonuclease/phosphatase family protein [Campylobacterales bacterium]HIP58973.1 endonuclease/exonuclease/phosphatase family protein [Campylobacterales bacterium]
MYRKLLPWHIDQKNHSVCIKKIENKHLKSDKFTLLNWNVHKNNHNFQWLHDFGQILHLYTPDFIAFQEYKTKSKRSILDSRKEYGYGFFSNIEMQKEDSGLINASTCDIEEFNPIFSKHVEPLIKTPKISFFTQYNLEDGQKLTLINTHMINFVKNKKYLSQIRQLEKLCADQDILILTGDFNTWSSKRMHLLKSMTDTLGLDQVSFEIDHHKKSYLAHPLDHLFYKGLKPIKSEILHQIKTSDHKPIIVEFTTTL